MFLKICMETCPQWTAGLSYFLCCIYLHNTLWHFCVRCKQIHVFIIFHQRPFQTPTHVPWANAKKQIWHRSNSQYVLSEPPWPIKGSVAPPCEGDGVWGVRGIVFEVLLLSERLKKKGIFNPVGSPRPYRRKKEKRYMLFHQYQRKEGGRRNKKI